MFLIGCVLASATFGSVARSQATTPGGIRADGVAAVVRGRDGSGAVVILRSDVELRARLLLLRARPERVPTGPIPIRLLRTVTDELVGEALIAREAQRVQVATPTNADIGRERVRIEESVGGASRLRAFLQAVVGSEGEIDEMAERRAWVNIFLTLNLEGATVVTDADVIRVFESGQHPFLGQSLEEAREPIRVWLSRGAMERAVSRWVAVLRTRNVVRIAPDLERAEDVAPEIEVADPRAARRGAAETP